MHKEVYKFIIETIDKIDPFVIDSILDIGSNNRNGSIKSILTERFFKATYTELDIEQGSNVDIIADARHFESNKKYDMIISTETLEHVQGFDLIIDSISKNIKNEGILILTCASRGRQPHNASGLDELLPDEYYNNVLVDYYLDLMDVYKFRCLNIQYEYPPGDLRYFGVKYE